MEYNITHNESKSRFEAEVEGLLCFIDYQSKDNTIIVTHTKVPSELEGRGIAAAMTKSLLYYIREKGLKVLPVCSYTQNYIQRHPEYNDLTVKLI